MRLQIREMALVRIEGAKMELFKYAFLLKEIQTDSENEELPMYVCREFCNADFRRFGRSH